MADRTSFRNSQAYRRSRAAIKGLKAPKPKGDGFEMQVLASARELLEEEDVSPVRMSEG